MSGFLFRPTKLMSCCADPQLRNGNDAPFLMPTEHPRPVANRATKVRHPTSSIQDKIAECYLIALPRECL